MSSPKHIRKALKLAGIRPSEVEITTAHGHIHIRYQGRLISASSSPKDKDTAALKIYRDLRRFV